jgi:hypothetical protein
MGFTLKKIQFSRNLSFGENRICKRVKQLPVFFSALILLSCKEKPIDIPAIYTSHSDTALHIINGKAFYKGSLFSGHIVDTNDKADTVLAMSYYNGLPEGMYRQWYADKQLAAERFFINGNKEGIHRGWWENGKSKFECHFMDDEYEGEVKEWNRDGFLYKIFHYHKGHEEGSEKLWWDDGRLRANYVVTGGERFGLTGQKLCKNNLKDSIFK